MIYLKVNAEKNLFVVITSEPSRIDVCSEATTFVYAGTGFKNEVDPNFYPAVCFDHTEAKNNSVVSFSNTERNELIYELPRVRLDMLMAKGLDRATAAYVNEKINGLNYDNDSTRWNIAVY